VSSRPASSRPPDGSREPPVPPATLLAAAALVGLQALALAGIAVFYVVELAVATTDDVTRAVVTAALAVVAAAGLGLVTRGLARRRRWARAPALVINVLVLPVAYDLVLGDRAYVGGPLLVWAVAVLVLLFVRPTDRALEE